MHSSAHGNSSGNSLVQPAVIVPVMMLAYQRRSRQWQPDSSFADLHQVCGLLRENSVEGGKYYYCMHVFAPTINHIILLSDNCTEPTPIEAPAIETTTSSLWNDLIKQRSVGVSCTSSSTTFLPSSASFDTLGTLTPMSMSASTSGKNLRNINWQK